MTREIRTYYKQHVRVKTNNNLPVITEQSHAQGLEIKNMINQGFQFSAREPIWMDTTNIPPLEILLKNRRKLQQLHNDLPRHIKQDLPTVDHLVNVLTNGSDDDLIELGLLKAKEIVQDPKPEDPTPPVDPQPETPAA